MSNRRCVIVGLNTGRPAAAFEKSMKEMEALAEAASFESAAVFTQNLPGVNTGYYIGSGKISEIRAYLEMNGDVDLVLFDNQLSPMQLGNLNRMLGAEVLDRTALILKIFAARARTREAALQVDYARLKYLLPRLKGMHDDLGRQGGTSGAMSNRGAGEKKIELDRRRIEQQMAELRRDLEEVLRERETQRKARIRAGLPRVSLVGYTNAGKSTILNALLKGYGADEEKQVFEKDMLFATLDTATRRIEPGDGRKPFLLTDTVGFIDNLPTTLVKAFRSTLEESCYADLLLIVSDVSDPDFRENLRVTISTLSDIGAGGIPRLYVFNKVDLAPDFMSRDIFAEGMAAEDHRITMSAKDPADVARLLDEIGECINAGRKMCEMLIPYTEGQVIPALMASSDVEILEYTEEGTRIRAMLAEENRRRYAAFLAE